MTWKARFEFKILPLRDLCWTMVVYGEQGPACLPSVSPLGPSPHMTSIVHVYVDCPASTSKCYSQPLQTAFLGLREVHSALRGMEMNLVLAVRARNSEVSRTW